MPDARSDVPPAALPPRSLHPARRNYRLIEVLVAMSILVTLAGMLVPYAERVAARTDLANATADLAAIAYRLASAGPLHGGWLRGPGELPVDCPREVAVDSAPLDRLSLPPSMDRRQRDALLLALQPDPWGSSYLIRGARVLSPGPDRTLNTPDDLAQAIP